MAKRPGPAAPQAGEVAVLPVPVAPTMRRNRPEKVVEADVEVRFFTKVIDAEASKKNGLVEGVIINNIEVLLRPNLSFTIVLVQIVFRILLGHCGNSGRRNSFIGLIENSGIEKSWKLMINVLGNVFILNFKFRLYESCEGLLWLRLLCSNLFLNIVGRAAFSIASLFFFIETDI